MKRIIWVQGATTESVIAATTSLSLLRKVQTIESLFVLPEIPKGSIFQAIITFISNQQITFTTKTRVNQAKIRFLQKELAKS
jgi:hypothetical protein